jgi:hypothetical protein
LREVWNRPGRVWLDVNALIGTYTSCPWHFRYASLKRLGAVRWKRRHRRRDESLIASRAKRSGQRWRMVGISAVLALRTRLDSERLERFWPHVASPFRAECKEAKMAA